MCFDYRGASSPGHKIKSLTSPLTLGPTLNQVPGRAWGGLGSKVQPISMQTDGNLEIFVLNKENVHLLTSQGGTLVIGVDLDMAILASTWGPEG